jgi:hypothetical protein
MFVFMEQSELQVYTSDDNYCKRCRNVIVPVLAGFHSEKKSLEGKWGMAVSRTSICQFFIVIII